MYHGVLKHTTFSMGSGGGGGGGGVDAPSFAPSPSTHKLLVIAYYKAV